MSATLFMEPCGHITEPSYEIICAVITCKKKCWMHCARKKGDYFFCDDHGRVDIPLSELHELKFLKLIYNGRTQDPQEIKRIEESKKKNRRTKKVI